MYLENPFWSPVEISGVSELLIAIEFKLSSTGQVMVWTGVCAT